MVRIAIIDDAINEEFLQNKTVKERIVVYSEGIAVREKEKQNACTHATICAMILEECTENYEIVSIQIMKDCETPTHIDSLVKALQMCLDFQVDIISMSIGTVRMSESLKLHEVIKALAEKNIIMVGAISNNQLLTLPALYPEVIGVQCDTKGFLKPMELIVHQENWLGTQVTANCDFEFFNSRLYPLQANHAVINKNISYLPSNSFAVPLVVAYINTYLNEYRKGNNILKLNRNNNTGNYERNNPSQKQVLEFLERKSPIKGIKKEWKRCKKIENQLRKTNHTIPHVCMVVSKEKDLEFGKRIVDELYLKHLIESIGFVNSETVEDIRFFSLKRNSLNIEAVESFLEMFSEAEMLFSVLTETEFQELKCKLDIDLIIFLKEMQTEFVGEGTKIAVLNGKGRREISCIANIIVEQLI